MVLDSFSRMVALRGGRIYIVVQRRAGNETTKLKVRVEIEGRGPAKGGSLAV